MSKFNWGNIFDFSNGEKKGIIFIVVFILAESILLINQPFKQKLNKSISSQLRDRISTLSESQSSNIKQKKTYENKSHNQSIEIKLVPFNPNKANYKTLVSVGITPKVAHTIINYRKKGGIFYKKTDLKRIYGLNGKTFHKIMPYIKISSENKKIKYIPPEQDSTIIVNLNTCTIDELASLKALNKGQAKSIIGYRKYLGGYINKAQLYDAYLIDSDIVNNILPSIILSKDNSTIDINNIDSAQLISIAGINGYVAKSLIKFRSFLGGYTVPKQIFEAYGIDSAVAQSIIQRIYIDSSKIKIYDINTAKIEELRNQYYINRKNAVKIINYRDLHGLYKNKKILLDEHLITPELYRKIAAYLTTK